MRIACTSVLSRELALAWVSLVGRFYFVILPLRPLRQIRCIVHGFALNRVVVRFASRVPIGRAYLQVRDCLTVLHLPRSRQPILLQALLIYKNELGHSGVGYGSR